MKAAHPASPAGPALTATPRRQRLAERIEQAWFGLLYSRNLVYNTAWEDPAVDRQALQLQAGDRVLVITSAGCNALDYALEAPQQVIAVDANPCQTALFELKLAAIRCLSYEDMFALFGRGRHADFAALYRGQLRERLSEASRVFWDRRTGWFRADGPGLYAQGLTGLLMRIAAWRMRSDPSLGAAVRGLFEQPDLQAQRHHYDSQVRTRFWTPWVQWFLGTPLFMSLIGVPMPQRQLLVAQHGGSVSAAIQAMIDELFRTVPAASNYFWGVYVFGEYAAGRCPRYLTPEGFAALKGGLVDRIQAHTCTVTDYLQRPGPTLTHAVLLDHMDWMSSYHPADLAAEWHALHQRMAPGGRILFRSAHVEPPFLDTLRVGPQALPIRQWLRFEPEVARQLALADRVHTYSSFHIAHVPEAR